jgi:hypothetical protein
MCSNLVRVRENAFMKRPYWKTLEPFFSRYGVELTGIPYETQMQKAMKGWLKEHDFELVPRQGQAIDIIDFEFIWKGRHLGIELKGHSNATHNLTKIFKQLQRYLQHVKFIFLIVHSPGLKGQIERFLTTAQKKFTQRIQVVNIREIDEILLRLEEMTDV